MTDRARELGFDPNYDLPRDSDHRSRAHGDSRIQTLLYREIMEAKLSAIRETDKLSGSFVAARDVAAVQERLETWSRLAFEFLGARPALR